MTAPVPQSDALLALSRQEAHLQSTLQTLLDAQSEGLLAGLTGGPPQDEASSTGSRTPTTTDRGDPSLHQSKPRSIIPVRQPARRKIGLRGARRGIARAIADLASLKSEEGQVLDNEIAERQGILSTVSAFERKSTGLREQIEGIQAEDSSQRVEHLQAEEKALGNSIHDLETQLYEMKARHRHLLREIDGLNNTVQSKLSSYESALALAEKDIKSFLARPPVETTSKVTTGVWALPRERRTLEMAKEHYTEEQQTLRTRIEAVQAEGSALEDGGAVWEGVVQEVNAVEKSLRDEMQRMSSSSSLVDTGENENETTTKGMKAILQTMENAKTRLKFNLDIAESNNWKLLVCCIGAELEALVEGQAVLEGALGASTAGGKAHSEATDSSRNEGAAPAAAEGALIDDSAPASSPRIGSSEPPRGGLDRSEDEDEGPGPEFLVSQHD